MSTKATSRKRIALVAQIAALTAPAFALGGAAFTSGSVTWSWDADTATTNGGKTSFTIAPPASSAMPTSPTFQLNRTGNFGSGVATGKGSIGYVANSTTASWTFSGGSGSAQNDPGDLAFPGDTLTKVQFGGLYDANGSGFGPTATGFFSLTAAGVAGINGSTAIDFNIQWRLGGPAGALLRSQVNGGTTFFGGGSGQAFSQTFTYCSAFSPSTVSASDNIWVGGFMTIAASNGGTPSDVAPIQFEASAAPPTATLYTGPGTLSNWEDVNTWAPPDQPAAGIFSFTEPGALVPAVPNAVGDRARIVNNATEQRSLQLNTSITLGALQIDDDGSLFIQDGGGASSLIMDVVSGNASIHVGAASGRGVHGISTNLVLADSLDIRVESDAPGSGSGSVLQINGPISTTGGPKDINVSGGGIVVFNNVAMHGGATNITDGGILRVTAPGGLGTGDVIVQSGQLVISTNQPFMSNSAIELAAGGFLQLNSATFGGGNNVVVSPGAGLSASSTVLSGLTVNGVSNISLAPGATVAHDAIDLSPATNPAGLGVTPLYIYGINTDAAALGELSIDVGTGTTSPWIGFGTDGLDRTFGQSPTDPNGAVINIQQNGILSAGGSELTVNARLIGGPTASVQVANRGIVSVDSVHNQYSGSIEVMPGTALRVNGALNTVQSVNVGPDATLGGSGSIGGNVVIGSGGALDPGLNKFNNALAQLTVNNLQLSPTATLDFEFGNFDSDQVHVLGTLSLDGELLLNQLQDFDNQGFYTLFTYDGLLIDNGLTISPLSQPIDGVPAQLAASILIIPNMTGPGGVVVLAVPEPGTFGLLAGASLLALRRRRR